MPYWGGSIGLCCRQDGCLTAPVAGSVLVSGVLVPCIASIPVTMSCRLHPDAYCASIGVGDDGG